MTYMVSQITYDRNARCFHVIADGEFIGYAKSNFEAEQLQHEFREEVQDWDIGTAAIAEVYQRRYTAQTPYPQHRPVERVCVTCGPTEMRIAPNGSCVACNDRAARYAAEDARIAAIDAQADAALAQADPAALLCACGEPGDRRLNNQCLACFSRDNLARRRAVLRPVVARAETTKQRARRERAEAGM